MGRLCPVSAAHLFCELLLPTPVVGAPHSRHSCPQLRALRASYSMHGRGRSRPRREPSSRRWSGSSNRPAPTPPCSLASRTFRRSSRQGALPPSAEANLGPAQLGIPSNQTTFNTCMTVCNFALHQIRFLPEGTADELTPPYHLMPASLRRNPPFRPTTRSPAPTRCPSPCAPWGRRRRRHLRPLNFRCFPDERVMD